MIFKELHEFMHSTIHDELLVLICSFHDEFILHSRTNVPKGESTVKPRKVPVPKTPLSSLFYRGRIVISSFTYLPEVVWKIRGHICDQCENRVGQWSLNNFRTSGVKIKFF